MTADKPDHAPEGKRECRPRPSLPCSGQAVLGEQILRGKSETVVSPLCGSQRRVLLRWARALNATKRSWLSAPKISCARCKVSSRVLQRKKLGVSLAGHLRAMCTTERQAASQQREQAGGALGASCSEAIGASWLAARLRVVV